MTTLCQVIPRSFQTKTPDCLLTGAVFCRRFLGAQADRLAFIRGSNWKGKLGVIVRNYGDAEIWTMAGSEPQPDYCPQCGSALDIVSVKFRFGRMAIVAACPNCALEFAEKGRVARSKAITESGKFAETARGLLRLTEAAMHRLAKRLRYILAVLFAAVVAAAALRHSIHVYGGFSREEIRGDALLAVLCVVAAIIVFRRRRRKPRGSERGQIPLGTEAGRARSNSASRPKRPHKS